MSRIQSAAALTGEWNWRVFGIYCFLCFILGLIVYALGLPGIVAVSVGGVLGACAGNWQWFETRFGTPIPAAQVSGEPVWKVKILGGQQDKAERRAVYDILEKNGIPYRQRSVASDAFHHGRDVVVSMHDPEKARAVVAELRSLDISAEAIEPQPNLLSAATGN
jgi:hypothetical protein